MPSYRVRSLPGLPTREPPLGPYEFQLYGLELGIPGPSFLDQRRAELPEQERWIDAHPLHPPKTWDCTWTFPDTPARDEFVAWLVAHGAVSDSG